MDQDQKPPGRTQGATRRNGEDGTDFAARRRVIRGAVGLPAIVTLASGRAASAASILNCALNEESAPSDGATLLVPYDNLDPSHRNLGTDVFDTGPGTAVRYKVTPPPGDNNLVLVDPDGEGGSDPLPVVASCYASFVGTGTG